MVKKKPPKSEGCYLFGSYKLELTFPVGLFTILFCMFYHFHCVANLIMIEISAKYLLFIPFRDSKGLIVSQHEKYFVSVFVVSTTCCKRSS